MLLQTIETLLAFLVLMLLLSLVVTGIVQVMQYAMQLRSRNLQHGIAALLEAVRGSDDTFSPQEVARQVVRSPLLIQGAAGERVRERMPFLKAPRTSWVELPELLAILPGLGISEGRCRDVEKWFARMEKNLSKRFLHNVRWITIVWALLVAFVFQANAFQWLRDLSADAELRGRLVAAVDEALAQADKTFEEVREYEDVADEALARLEARHPDLEPLLEEASGIGSDRESIVAELQTVLAPSPQRRDAVVAEYEQLLDDLYEEGRRRAVRSTQDVLALSARLGISPWPRGAAFYLGPEMFYNWAGVLVMGILLSFGAPFWFEQLKNVVALRDALTGKGRGKS